MAAPRSLSCIALAVLPLAAAAADPGSPFRDCPQCPEMVVVPAGEFRMGSPDSEASRDEDEGPLHAVTLPRAFAVGRVEVTFEEWDACVAAKACERVEDEGWGRGRRPAINMDHAQASGYVKWLAATTGKPYRLLTEAEWEYAARAGSTTARPWGDDAESACKHANVYDSSSAARYQFQWGAFPCNDGVLETAPVGSFAPNAFGLHDMLGNVWEWVEDCYVPGYAAAPQDGSASHAGSCFKRVSRGGSWNIFPQWVRSAYRYGVEATKRSNNVGLRVARDL